LHEIISSEHFFIWPSRADLHLVTRIRMKPKRCSPAVDELTISDSSVILRKNTTFVTLSASQGSGDVRIVTNRIATDTLAVGANEVGHDLQITFRRLL